MIESALKSRTFWGGLVFAVAKFLETQGLIPGGLADTLEAVGVAIGLLGARNARK